MPCECTAAAKYDAKVLINGAQAAYVSIKGIKGSSADTKQVRVVNGGGVLQSCSRGY
jgi:hypothetical protein